MIVNVGNAHPPVGKIELPRPTRKASRFILSPVTARLSMLGGSPFLRALKRALRSEFSSRLCARNAALSSRSAQIPPGYRTLDRKRSYAPFKDAIRLLLRVVRRLPREGLRALGCLLLGAGVLQPLTSPDSPPLSTTQTFIDVSMNVRAMDSPAAPAPMMHRSASTSPRNA